METYESIYEKIKPSIDNKTSFKEFKESGLPRTFSEMFNENGEVLKESQTFDEKYLRENETGKFNPDSVTPEDAAEQGGGVQQAEQVNIAQKQLHENLNDLFESVYNKFKAE